jgi:hypothetical protein
MIDGRALNFCCAGCLRVYEFLREDAPLEKIKAKEGAAGDSKQGM